jgi:hypothetical protein
MCCRGDWSVSSNYIVKPSLTNREDENFSQLLQTTHRDQSDPKPEKLTQQM